MFSISFIICALLIIIIGLLVVYIYANLSKHDSDNKKHEKEIERLAYYDILTGLPNLTFMSRYIDSVIAESELKQSAFLFLNIDNFKQINDAFGHLFGDSVLKEMSAKLVELSRDYIVSRYNGDELAVFIPHYESLDMLKLFIENIIDELSIHYENKVLSHHITVSIGVSLMPQHSYDYGSLLKYANIAMNQAKITGKNRYVIFSARMNEHFIERKLIEKDLRSAIENNTELLLYLQPQYTISTGDLFGFEVLVRWKNEQRGFVSPGMFIPLAEETQLIIPLGKWILFEACTIIEEIRKRGYGHLKISVNLSPVQLLDENLLVYIKEALDNYNIIPSMLELEITENILMENLETTIKILEEIRNLGISIALDDFGTGYSSLNYLKLLPISTLKIDKSFIDDISSSKIGLKITKEIINLSHMLDFNTIAEGIETVEQLECLRTMNCDIIQGYLGGEPAPKEEIFEMLHKKLMAE